MQSGSGGDWRRMQATRRRSFAALSISIGIWAGALAGATTALGDYGAHWLFMESARDRLWLLVRLLTTQPAAGACIGAVAGCLVASARVPSALLSDEPRRMRLARGLRAALFSALLAAPTCAVARLLFSGGKMSRIAQRDALVVCSAVLLMAAVACTWWVGERLFVWARVAPWRLARRALLLLLGAGLGLSKLSQLVLPNLYDYLHAVLSASAFACYGLCAAVVVSRALGEPRRVRWLWLGGAVCAALLLLAARLSISTLDRNQNVRVALGSANMPHSHSLMLALTPLLPRVDPESAGLAKQRAAAARQRRAATPEASALATAPDAHVLLITIDALRADHLGLLGYGRGVTPELDALGARGVVFEHAYAQAPHSSYSLCSLMVSEYLHETTELGVPPPRLTLPRVLAAAGYHTAAFYTQGIFHTAAEQLGMFEEDAFGFAFHDHQDRPAEEMTDRALTEIDRTIARGEPSALFWVHYFDVHEPYEATTLGTSDMDRYDSELLATDRAIGRLVRATAARVHKPLIVVITSDHGEEFHEHGGVYHGSSLYEEQVHVPLIVLVPGVDPVRVPQPVESIDIAPTLLALLDVERPESMRGTDLRPWFKEPRRERGPVFSAVIHKKMAVSWPYKLVADLRFGSFELYDLTRDPNERDNRADREPERVRNLRGEVYAWLDSLSPAAHAAGPDSMALEWGRLGDRRAVEPLLKLLLDETAETATRSEAARLLGKLADPETSDRLFAATRSPDAWVAAEAAIALGRLFDARAAPLLRRLIASEDPGIRSRAAVSLGRLREPAAIPSLIDALWLAPNLYEREEAVRWLGRLRDARALEPLLEILPEPHTRHLVVVALGELGDLRALAPLTRVLETEHNTTVRDGVVRGLAMLGDARALPVLLPLVTDDPALRNTGEALVRLHALERKAIGGVDLDAQYRGTAGFGHCYTGPLRHDWDFLHRTSCTSERDHAQLRLSVPRSVADAREGSVLLLSIKRADTSAGTDVELRVGELPSEHVRVDGAWSEQRFTIPAGALQLGSVRAELRVSETGARLEVDHVLLVPRAASAAAEAHGG
jgi:arylsulfatase A-like enzyme